MCEDGTVRSGEIDVGIKIAGLASELGFKAGEYEIVDVWVADSDDGIIEVDLRDTASTGIGQDSGERTTEDSAAPASGGEGGDE